MAINYSPKIIRDGLVLCLDAANPRSYPGTGTTWFDLSGNNNHFTIFNSPTYSLSRFTFDGVNDYMRSTNTINLSSTNAITVDVGFKVPTVTTNVMVFEFTANWNTNAGAFGAFTNSNGGLASSPTTDNDIHTNSSAETEDFNVSNITARSIYSFVYQSGVGTSLYYNSALAPTLRNSTVSSFTGFANNYLYIGSRGGTSSFGILELDYIRIYNRALTADEVKTNFNALRGRYGI